MRSPTQRQVSALGAALLVTWGCADADSGESASAAELVDAGGADTADDGSGSEGSPPPDQIADDTASGDDDGSPASDDDGADEDDDVTDVPPLDDGPALDDDDGATPDDSASEDAGADEDIAASDDAGSAGRADGGAGDAGPTAGAPPMVTINHPGDGEVRDPCPDTFPFIAVAQDPEDGELSAAIEWTSSRDGQLGRGGTFDACLSSGQHTITATVIDSDGNPSADSITLTITGGSSGDAGGTDDAGTALGVPPVVTINHPGDGELRDPCPDTIPFIVAAQDLEDGELSTTVQWVSSLDGQLGEGATFDACLSPGQHTITASVVDSDGNPGSDSITLTITDG